ncbi:cell fate (sporulation/competence/biofilm development) regulator YlbF (YheA/YmcA/DUF963 family) [Alicyclobacillus sacchari]|uniref:Cell fate (Sporulation/competence/biofilm development) regulator YlbF (YheA/YmcA/DUF963 family) n=1 Tax=Alicyclobacillus sacchari TaxID=392010 RepID=A0A4R8LUH1_9BACL|nr:YlbF family regulator [Alicyclobacillus sacchari]TDY51314.1 cell fate (sporulation/competence/biofilm development) regulator YlbF (YheA/YmcA/DUF963 family) [Alicyclobacillus sacchari]GMA56615.1 hypothetical protein GCM10025858_11180 [Alicyclobacillus sacchari]
MNPYDHAHALAKAIREWEPFLRAREAVRALDQDPSAKDMLIDYLRRRMRMEAKQLRGDRLTEEEVSTMQKLAEVVQLNVNVNKYLQADRELQTLLMDVHAILAKTLADVQVVSAAEMFEEMGRNE